ncbi:sulfotransferase 1C2-like [Ptychodera flava]|uniref:sulfotransferase 1C2-like n=1 Tax=Ptychodera flava TaxID=63121 RepID=UPI00396A6574
MSQPSNRPPREFTHLYKGVRFPWMAPRSSLEALPTFQVRQDDIWLLTYSKAGTTWTDDIVNKILLYSGIRTDDDPDIDSAPYVEFSIGPQSNQELLSAAPSPRVITSHVLPEFLPTQIYQNKPKIIYIARNPKDIITSYLYHFKVIPIDEDYTSIRSIMDHFTSGNIIYGEWPCHVIHWWKKRHEENVLFLKYEDMKKDLKSAVAKIVQFLGINLDSKTITLIAEQTTIEATKQRKIKPKDYLLKKFNLSTDTSPFVRKGMVGDWKNHFSVVESEEFDKWYKEAMGDIDLTFQFE